VLLTRKDFEDGFGDWGTRQFAPNGTPWVPGSPDSAAGYSLTIVDDTTYGKVARLELRDGDDPMLGGVAFGERVQIMVGPFVPDGAGGLRNPISGDVLGFRTAMKLSAPFPNRQAFYCFDQFHRLGNGESPVAFTGWGDTLYLQVNAAQPSRYMRALGKWTSLAGRWLPMEYLVKFSSGSDGWIDLAFDGGARTRVYSGRTLFDSGTYMNRSHYRDGSFTETAVVWYAPLEVHDGWPSDSGPTPAPEPEPEVVPVGITLTPAPEATVPEAVAFSLTVEGPANVEVAVGIEPTDHEALTFTGPGMHTGILDATGLAEAWVWADATDPADPVNEDSLVHHVLVEAPDPEPDPEPVDPCAAIKAERDTALAQRDAAIAERNAALAKIDAAKAALA
jgi:hypothetical protein